LHASAHVSLLVTVERPIPRTQAGPADAARWVLGAGGGEVYASLIRTILANHLVYIDLLERPPTRAPLHGMAVALALNVCASRIQNS